MENKYFGRAIRLEEDVTVIATGENAVKGYEELTKMAENARDITTNFDRITESPEKLAEFIDKIICHCSDHDKDCTECPMRENRNCDYETTLEWLNQEGEE